jgi:hypothetical protein
MKIAPARRVLGRLAVPGDKSVSHRTAIIAALARGRSRLGNFSASEDCAAPLRCLCERGHSPNLYCFQIAFELRTSSAAIDLPGVLSDRPDGPEPF